MIQKGDKKERQLRASICRNQMRNWGVTLPESDAVVRTGGCSRRRSGGRSGGQEVVSELKEQPYHQAGAPSLQSMPDSDTGDSCYLSW